VPPLAVTNAAGTAALVVGMSGQGSLTLNNGANVIVNQLLVTNNTVTATNSFFSLLNYGKLTTSNAANAVAAKIVLAAGAANYYYQGNWNMDGGSNLFSRAGGGVAIVNVMDNTTGACV